MAARILVLAARFAGHSAAMMALLDEPHVSCSLAKLGLTNRVQAAILVHNAGLEL